MSVMDACTLDQLLVFSIVLSIRSFLENGNTPMTASVCCLVLSCVCTAVRIISEDEPHVRLPSDEMYMQSTVQLEKALMER